MAGIGRPTANIDLIWRAKTLLAQGALLSVFLAAAAPSAAAQSSSVVKLDDAGQAAAAYFLLETHLDAAASIDEMRDWYAERVSYYGRGVQDRALVLTDKKYYVDRWPVRSVAPDLSTLEVKTVSDGVYDLTVEVDFSVANDKTSISGRTRVELTVEIAQDGIRITRESGRILSRRGSGE